MGTREIKFRAWNPKIETMVYSFDRLEGFWHYVNNAKDIDGFELMQYTGLKDKNGKEIYEGDIILIHHMHPKWDGKESRWQITTQETAWGYAFDWEHISGYECSIHVMEGDPCNYEVIGNIYENAELLEV